MPDSLFKPPAIELSPAQVEETFKELASSIETTEVKVKEVEDAFNTSPVSSINQLRYAGYHLCQVIAKSKLYTTPATIEYSHILSAYKHSLRAYYDALDHASVIVTSAFRQMEQTYNDLLVPLSTHFPDYYTWRLEIDSLAGLRSLGEENALYENAADKGKREDYYARLDAKIKTVLVIYRHIPLMADRLAVIVAQQAVERAKEEKQELLALRTQKNWAITQRNWAIGVAIGVVLAVIGWFVIYYSKKPDTPLPAISAPQNQTSAATAAP
jgi:hypothetical protein